jgi:4-cresol dehydrogenase (hydroxylating)
MSDLNRRDVLGVLGASAAAVPALARALPIDGAMLPSGVSSTAFAAAVRELKAIVGPDNVFADAETILPYEKKFIPDTAKKYRPSGAVAPANTDEVQAILRVANKYRLPFWPVSTGKNMGYGMTSPATPGR